MRIFSPLTEYTLLTRVFDDGRRFVARDRIGNTRLLVVVEDALEAKRHLPLLIEWESMEPFTDLIEFFPYGGGLVATFAFHTDGLPIERALNGASYPHRAAVLRSLFGRVLVQNLPEEILREALRPENLLVSESGRVRLLYDLPRGGTAGLPDAVRLITGATSATEYELFGGYFLRELQSILNDPSRDYSDAYAAATKAAAALEEYVPPPNEPPTLQKLQNRVSTVKEGFFSRWKVLIAVAALALGYAAVGILFYDAVVRPPAVDNGIRSIGTVVVGDGG